MDQIRILHTADVHIGAPFEFLGAKGAEQRQAIRDAFERITRMAREEGYQVLLIAGDLFDSAYTVSERDLSFVIGCLAGIPAGCHVVMLPGSHDFWSPGTIYEREQSRIEMRDNIHILTPQIVTVEIPEISLAVHGKALTSRSGSISPMSGLDPMGNLRWNIAMAHGSVEGASAARLPVEHPIDPEDLRSGFDYIALGHWHSYNVISGADPPAVYCGAPELIARDQKGAGSVVSITLSGGGVEFERIRVGKRRIKSLSVDCTGLNATEELIKKVTDLVPGDGTLVLELSLTGLIGSDSTVDPDLAVDQLGGAYFSVRLSGRRAEREIAREKLLEVSEETVAGKFIRILLERIKRASGDEKEILEEALQVGYQLFRGRNPLE